MISRLQEETARVEKCLLEGNFTEAIVQCFNAPKASAFDYNLLEPLQKLLRLSSPVAASLARPDLFSGILQKFNQKKGVVRLNLLRIVRSICDASEDEPGSLREHPLFQAIQQLAESDASVLVRNMASDLVKFNLEKNPEGSSTSSVRSRQPKSRKSSYTPPTIHQSGSMPASPMTPTQTNRLSQPSAFIDGSVTPRRGPPSSNGSDSLLYRPRSKDGPISNRKPSGEAAASKSRLPRTALLRSSRSSMAAPTVRDEAIPATSARPERVRLRDTTQRPATSSSAGAGAGGGVSQLSSKRRTRQPSGDTDWS